ncbi:uncharacterized protein LOC120131866 [Hibiscus syriacus]|uniref:uncharacterized protein LOC120131866 n=1 Tax=Hibiscus syriacus TaxID=106335 RepID=UPI0019240E79|nr:uncharacterized protein LOC120131866 [Hibiscus syriacus]
MGKEAIVIAYKVPFTTLPQQYSYLTFVVMDVAPLIETIPSEGSDLDSFSSFRGTTYAKATIVAFEATQLMVKVVVSLNTTDKEIHVAFVEATAAEPADIDGINDYTSLRSSNGSMDMGSAIDEASGHGGERFAITTYISPRLTPEAPKIISISGSSRGYSAAGSPQRTGVDSPTKPQHGGTSPSWYSSSQQSSAASTPSRRHSLPARSPRIDGNEFFRQAMCQLSYEHFSAFLANIKELNAVVLKK